MAKSVRVKGKVTGKLRDLTDRLINHRIAVEHYSTSTVKKIHRLLEDAGYDLEKRLRRAHLDKKTIETLRATLADIKDLRAATFESLEAIAKFDMINLTAYEGEFLHRLYTGTLADVLPEKFEQSAVGAVVLRQLVTKEFLSGRTITEWVSKLRTDELERIKVQLRLGIVEGDTNAQIVSRIIGGEGYRGVIEATKRWAETLVRTAVSDTTQGAHMAYLEENKKLFPQVMWVAVLDEATCRLCAAYAGEIYPIDDLPDEIPAHPNCRCVYVGVANGMPTEEFSAKFSFDNWLKRQTPERAKEVLGPGRYELWKGGMSVRSFIDTSGRALTLDELRAADASYQPGNAPGLQPGNKPGTNPNP